MIQKVVRGSAMEPNYITPQWAWRTQKDFIWVTAQAQVHQRHQNSVSHVKKQSHLTVNPLVMLELASVSASFHMAGGAINRIIQKPGCVAISSATSGGQSDVPGATAQPHDTYNREGTLQFWQDNKGKSSAILHGHCVLKESQNQTEGLLEPEVYEPTCHRCYTVNGISFDPNQSHLMVSAGNNCTIQLWQDHKKLNNAYYKYPRAPYDVAYREKDSLLAVTCMNGSVFVHQTQWGCLVGDPVELHVVPPNVQHSVGAIIWGQGASADMLFASSESQGMDDYSGFHVALDPDQGRCVYKFSASESGDGMALDPDGARLALCTAALDGTHFLRIYDVHRGNGQRATQEVQLNHFHADFTQSASQEGEVTAVSFSPDGLLLAIARSDDEVHVYDSRFMGQGIGPMRRFLHWGDDCCMAGDKWGVVDAVWVNGWCGRGLGIVTGGSDGCVRFWDVCRSADDIQNGDVLAQPNSDIGHFSVGDPRNGEKPLVVGDNGGRVYVYDHATACSSHF
ncbi:WD40-repeat-containing domain protein [Lactifluus subvellereus]|nr:WD40-repeat-containing domain protein [Lactifluus subvellereus]